MHSSQQIIIGNYSFKLSEILGKGSTGYVYSGQRISDGLNIAIKAINLKQNVNQVTKNLLQSQKKALIKLSGKPYILKIFDIIQNDQFCYIVTEICNGGTLKDFIIQKGKIPEEEALSIFKKILIGYCAISDALIIHRDLKPANIMMDSNNEPIIIDFGYSQIIQTKTVMRAFNVGSPSYMSPQAHSKTLFSQKSDIWALGIILYQMLTGKTLDNGFNIKSYFDSLTSDFIFRKLINFSITSHELLSQVLKIQPHERISCHKIKYILDKYMIQKMSRNSTITPTYNLNGTQSLNFSKDDPIKKNSNSFSKINIKNKIQKINSSPVNQYNLNFGQNKFKFIKKLTESRYTTIKQQTSPINLTIKDIQQNLKRNSFINHQSINNSILKNNNPQIQNQLRFVSHTHSNLQTLHLKFSIKKKQHFQMNEQFSKKNINVNSPLPLIMSSRQNFQRQYQMQNKYHPIHTLISQNSQNNQYRKNIIFQNSKCHNNALMQNNGRSNNILQSSSKQNKFSFKKQQSGQKNFKPINYNSIYKEKQNIFIPKGQFNQNSSNNQKCQQNKYIFVKNFQNFTYTSSIVKKHYAHQNQNNYGYLSNQNHKNFNSNMIRFTNSTNNQQISQNYMNNFNFKAQQIHPQIKIKIL